MASGAGDDLADADHVVAGCDNGPDQCTEIGDAANDLCRGYGKDGEFAVHGDSEQCH